MRFIHKQSVFLMLSGLLTCYLINQCIAQNQKFEFSDIYSSRQPKVMEKLPVIEAWLDNKSYLTWEENDKKAKVILKMVDAPSGNSKVHADFSEVNKRFNKGILFAPWDTHNTDYRQFIICFKDDLYYFSANDGKIKQLTDTESIEKNPTFSPNSQHIAFTRDNDLFSYNLETGEEQRLTNDGTNLIYNGYASWVYYEEILGRRSKYKAFWWSPDNKKLAFLRFDDTPVPEFPIFLSEGIHGKLKIQRYPKAGDKNPFVKLGVIHLDTNQLQWIDSNETSDSYIAWPFWTADGEKLLYQKLNRGQDEIDIIKAELLTGLKETIYEEAQTSWIDFFEDLYVLESGRGFILRSDITGWRHLYLYSLEGKLKNRITEGDMNVAKIIRIDETNQKIFFEGFKGSSLENRLFSIKFNGSELLHLTREEGYHSTKVSANGDYFIDSHSHINQPEKMTLFDKNGGLIRVLHDKNLKIPEIYELGKTELFEVHTEDGVVLPALWVLPPGFDKSKKYPVIVQVYGGPGRANVRNRFRSLSNQYLAQNDIIIFSVDHRGSYHFGKKGQSNMHRNLGKWEMHDYMEAAKWLLTLPFVDKDRIGIIGGSYGGYVTAMAMTYGSEYFTHGVSLYPVTDWQLYDAVYTERYMDAPEENSKGYKFGSVMTHAEKLKGKLLLIHGAVDDNVHMQNTSQLIQALQKLDKSFELMIYPNQKHGIRSTWRRHNQRETVDFWFRHFFGEGL